MVLADDKHFALRSRACALLCMLIQNHTVATPRGFPDFRYQIAPRWLLLLVDEFPVLAPFIAGPAARLYV